MLLGYLYFKDINISTFKDEFIYLTFSSTCSLVVKKIKSLALIFARTDVPLIRI
jgi:hypothetical protein